MVNCFRILHSSAGLFMVFIMYCIVDVRRVRKDGVHKLALRRISSGMSLLVTSERTSVFRVKYSDLLGYLRVNKNYGEGKMNIPFSREMSCSPGEQS